ncbi:hypothetical protein [Streptomyces sp. NBC_01304]|uniref:hypothetical protein n=1 Tax=Streptomyces sp. NBC_01304 TaxID=2903818 RepID=UPI002E116F2F|nr:hypothetical protein OG430_06850 [Streptomyces sp. NBC_01304]
MYALVLLVPFILLGAVMSLAWWEDRILPPTAATEAPAEAPSTPVAAPDHTQPPYGTGSLTDDAAEP